MTETEFNRIVRRNQQRLYLIAFAYYHEQYEAEDAVQNTFLKLWKTNKSFQDDTHIDKWLTKVCVNECKHNLILRMKHPTEPLNELNEAYFDSYKDFDLLKALSALHKNERLLLHLYYYEDMTVKQIAKVMQCSEGAAKTRLFRARNKLKLMMEVDSNNEY